MDSRGLALDCGTGSGQAAGGLAGRFECVIAIDASTSQLAAASPHRSVDYVCAHTEHTPLANESVDLVTAAQALHWFATPAFFAEVRRVLVRGGVFAAWCYQLPTVDRGVDSVIRDYHTDVVGSYWQPERRHVEVGYRSIEIPFDEIPLPPVDIAVELTLDELAGYVGTWSATLAYAADRGTDPVRQLRDRLRASWPDPHVRRTVRWPVTIRAGRVW